MEDNRKPENLSEYFSLQIRKLLAWFKPDPADHFLLIVVKSILKGLVVLVMLLLSPVLIIGLILAFVAPF